MAHYFFIEKCNIYNKHIPVTGVFSKGSLSFCNIWCVKNIVLTDFLKFFLILSLLEKVGKRLCIIICLFFKAGKSGNGDESGEKKKDVKEKEDRVKDR